jgi:hypothetical protein
MNARFSLFAAVSAAVASVGLTSCMSAHPPLGMPDVSVIDVTPANGGQALPPDCAQLVQRSGMRDAGFRRPGVAFGCATYTNLAAMVTRPEDFVAPRPYAGADAPLAASAVRRYEEDRAKPLNQNYSSSSSSSSSSANSTSGSR